MLQATTVRYLGVFQPRVSRFRPPSSRTVWTAPAVALAHVGDVRDLQVVRVVQRQDHLAGVHGPHKEVEAGDEPRTVRASQPALASEIQRFRSKYTEDASWAGRRRRSPETMASAAAA